MTTMRTSVQRSIIVGVVTVLGGCVTPYKTPLLDPADATFSGIEDFLGREQAVNVLSIHGMCTHDETWVDKTVGRIDANLENLDAASRKPVPVPGVELFETSFTDSSGTTRLRNYALVWSPLTAAGKKSLCYDSGDTTPSCTDPSELNQRKRGWINDAVKSTLMNDCLSDVVLYLGPDGAKIREAFRSSIDAIAARNSDAAPLILISESLGSKILADSVLETVDNQEARVDFLRSTEQVFMAANQLPLIELSEDRTKRGDNTAWSQLLDAILTPPVAGKTSAQVIAFTDPNDLLSYELRNRTFTRANAIVSNDKTWFWTLERPDMAHTGYLDNEEVWKLIVCGSSGRCSSSNTPP